MPTYNIMSGAEIILIASEIAAVGEIGLKTYIVHRKNMIEQGREDELISSRVKKFSQEVIKSLSRESSPMVRFDTVYEDEISDKDEIPDETDKVRLSFSQRLKRKSINGINNAVSFLRKKYMPTKSSLEETSVQLTEEVIENVVVSAIEKTKYNPLIYNWFIKKPLHQN